MRTKIIAEVIEAKNCAAHVVEARYVIRGKGVVETKACSDWLCIDVFLLLAPFHHRVFDRITEGGDVKGWRPLSTVLIQAWRRWVRKGHTQAVY